MSVPTIATTVYPLRDVSGQLVAEHVRKDLQDGSKQCMWRQPGGKWGLNGTRLEELPLYGIERLADWPEEYPVVLVEGEKAADALNGTDHILALGTVTGASSAPGVGALEALRGREVVLWPDADDPGRAHMEKTAEGLQGVAELVRLYAWPEAPEKGADAADHPAILAGDEKSLGILLNDLLGAPAWRPPEEPPAANDRSRPPRGFNLTDMGNAERFVAHHGRDVRYCYPWGKWLVWTGAHWERDDSGRVHRLAKEAVRGIYAEASAAEDEGRRKAIAQHATRSEAEARIKAMLELAKSEVPVSPDDLDADPWLLNVPNGALDLKSGELRPHRREDLLTKMVGAEYNPDAPAPAWAAFLERVLPGEELRRFVRRAAGYSLTGDTSEQVMFINHGGGNNGKSTFQEALSEALGDYAMRAPTEMLMVKRGGGVPNDVARLKGGRFVTASETEEGRRLAESLVKDLTGQDTITARFMRAEFFDFKPSHKLWLSTNHKPEIKGTDNAIWRRIRLVPWSVVVPPAERDRELPEKLRAELAGVLAWAVRGCIEWRREGLGESEEVRVATAEYRAEQDVLAAFIEEVCVVRPEAWVRFADLHGAYAAWCEEARERAENKRGFGARLKERGFEPGRGTGNVPIRYGLALRSDREPSDGGGFDRGPQGNSGRNSYPTVTEQNTCKSEDSECSSYRSYPQNTISSLDFSPREVTVKKGNYGNYGNSEAEKTLASKTSPEPAAFLANPPRWWLDEAAHIAGEGYPVGKVRALACSTSTEVYGTAHRWSDVLEAVQDWLEREAGS